MNTLDAKTLKKIFSVNLNRLLEQSGHNKSELATYMDVSTSTVSDWCNGNKYPRMDKVEKIAAWFGVMKSQLTETVTPIPDGCQPLPHMVRKPRLGVIACGTPILAEENIDGYDDVPDHIHCDFTLKCEGDSMIGARIHDGDIVYIRQQPDVENGEIAAVMENGEKTLKRVYKYPGKVVLQPENPKYPPIVYVGEELSTFCIIGKAVGFTSLIK